MKFPRLHNAMWPGLVGKGPGSEPFIVGLSVLRVMLAVQAAHGWDAEEVKATDQVAVGQAGA